jgi:NAD(P)-dependent dehydrogenase (short-subunit alcohol dehydrogenase family)
MSSPFDLTGRVALVTGSTRGIGRAIATQMARAGARVAISSRKPEACEETRAALAAEGHDVLARPCNVSRSDDLEQLVAATLARWGRIDVLVCNAATNPVYGPTASVPEETFDKIIDTNLKSTWMLCNRVIPQMAERGSGAVILVSSVGALIGDAGIGLYNVSKAAELQLARNLAVEWGPRNVRVNALLPGLIRTDFSRVLWEQPERHAQEAGKTALKRIGEPDEIAGAALFLASSAASFVTGQALVADGGLTIC